MCIPISTTTTSNNAPVFLKTFATSLTCSSDRPRPLTSPFVLGKRILSRVYSFSNPCIELHGITSAPTAEILCRPPTLGVKVPDSSTNMCNPISLVTFSTPTSDERPPVAPFNDGMSCRSRQIVPHPSGTLPHMPGSCPGYRLLQPRYEPSSDRIFPLSGMCRTTTEGTQMRAQGKHRSSPMHDKDWRIDSPAWSARSGANTALATRRRSVVSASDDSCRSRRRTIQSRDSATNPCRAKRCSPNQAR